MIEGGPEAAVPARPPPAPHSSGRAGVLSPVGRLGGFFHGFGRFRLRRAPRREGDPFLANVNLGQRILWVVLLGLSAYLAADLLLVKAPAPISRLAAPGPAVEPPGEGAAEADPMRPLSEFMASVQTRNPFSGDSSAGNGEPTQTARQRLEEVVQGLVVVGIDRSATPEALVEDTKQGRTHFVRVGDQLNGLTVREITGKGVVLTYEGEEYLLQ